MNDWRDFHYLLRLSHIVAGMLGLILFWVPVLSRKGSRLHIVTGRAFVWLAYYVSATACVSCLWALAKPVHFTGITRELTLSEITELAAGVRFFFSILGLLMIWLVAGLQLGMYSIRNQGVRGPTHSRVLAFQILALVLSLSMAVYGLNLVFHGAGSRSWLAIALGVFGMLDSRKTIGYLKREPGSEKAWWFMHMDCMLGSGIAFHTAFFVFGFSRLLNIELEGNWMVVPWLIPAAVGVPAAHFWTQYYRRKFEAETAAG